MSDEELRELANRIAEFIFNDKELREKYLRLREEAIRRKRLDEAIFVEIMAISNQLAQGQQVR
ncbi:MAG: hypothetical protein IJV05_06045 [Muribaculaceae bacterium]|nr:hypothetical protein [Muribaculaceae bacterium]